MEQGILSGIRILDFGSFLAGPTAATFMGFMGADVIKVESRKRFDGARVYVQAPNRPMANPEFGEQFFDSANMNKRSLTADLTTEKGREIVLALSKHCDIVIENMTPGTMEKLGLGYEQMKKGNPDIIYIASSACGDTGPDRFDIGYAANFATKAGLGHLTGYEDGEPSLFVGAMDLRSASNAAIAILACLFHREMTGEGQFVDLSSQETMAVQLGDVYTDYTANGVVQGRTGNHRENFCPHNVYCCNEFDTWVSIAVETQEEWKALCGAIRQPELAYDPRFSSYEARKRHEDELDAIISSWSKQYSKFEAAELLQKAGVAAGPLLDAKDMVDNPHVVANNSYAYIDHPTLGRDFQVNPPWKFSKSPARITRHAPGLGEHTEEILRDLLGYGTEEIQQLSEQGIV